MKTLLVILSAVFCTSVVMASTEAPADTLVQQANNHQWHKGQHHGFHHGHHHGHHQGHHHRGFAMMINPTMRVEMMDKKLSLTDEQKTKLTELFTKQIEERRAKMAERKRQMQENYGRPKVTEEMIAQMTAEREAQNEEIKKILTAEQCQKYEEMQKSQHNKRQQRGGNCPQKAREDK